MAKVTGIGGVFFKSADPQRLGSWYREHLGIAVQPWNGAVFKWRLPDQPEREGATAWSLFPKATDHFGPGGAPFMINYRVENLDALLTELRAQGVQVDDHTESSEYGRFGWITDPEGNRIELWQPPAE